MPVNYHVGAEVVDIRADKPRATDSFLVDTNVWFWVTYTRASMGAEPPRAHQTRWYPRYLSAARRSRAALKRCGLSLAELAHGIERTEREIYEASAGGTKIPNKEFRHNLAAERANVATEVQTAWEQVKGIAAPVDVLIDDPTADAALARFATQLLDGYDLFIVEALSRAGIVQVLTDDGDYCTVPGIQVFTANERVINAAQVQAKLLTR